jgi:hypothetical protein
LFQHFRLVDILGVVENIHLGWDHTPRNFSKEKLSLRIKPLMEEFGFDCDPSAKIEDLTVGEHQRVEIMRVLVCGARLLYNKHDSCRTTIWQYNIDRGSLGTTLIFSHVGAESAPYQEITPNIGKSRQFPKNPKKTML